MDFNNTNQNKIIQNKLSQIIPLYENGNSCTTISKMIKMSRNDISKYLKHKGIKIDKDRHKHIFTIKDENIFENINTSEKAQILGLIYADGCVYKNYDITNISLKEDDIEYLKKINDYIGFSRPVSLEKKETVRYFKENNKFYKCKNAYSIRIRNKKIKDDLMKHGICYNKSYVDFDMPDIDEKLFNSFILGYFEGDGCITTSSIKNRKCISKSFTILCQPTMAERIQKIFKKQLDIDSKIYIRKARPLLRSVSVTKNNDIIKLYHWLYKDTTFCMKRKHDIFKFILQNLETYGYNIGKTYKFD